MLTIVSVDSQASSIAPQLAPLSLPNALARGREAFQHRRWSEAFAELSASEAESPLAPADHETLVVTEYLLSSDAGGVDTWERVIR